MTVTGHSCARCGWIFQLLANLDGELICWLCWRDAGRPFPKADDAEAVREAEERLAGKGRA